MSESQHDVPPGPPPPGPPPGPSPQRRLHRSRRDRVVAGVCGGLGEYFDVDPVIFRIAFVVLAFVGGAGFLLYPAAWLLLPEEGHRRSIGDGLVQRGRQGHWFALALIVIGALILSGDLLSRHHGGGLGFAVIAIVVGVLLLRRHPVPPPPPAPPTPWTPTPPSAPTSGDPSDTPTTEPATEPLTSSFPPPPPYSPPPAPPGGGGGASWGPDTEELRPPKGRSLSGIVLSILLIGGGAVGLLHAAGALSVSVPVFLAAAVIFVGVALVISAWTGGSGGLIAIGLVLTIALGIASVVRVPVSGGWGQRRWVPSSPEEVHTYYKHGIGDLTIDLSHVAFPAEGQLVRVRLGVGHVTVITPADARVAVHAHTRVGELNLFGRQRDTHGFDVTDSVTSGNAQQGNLRLNIDLGVGAVDVERPDTVVPLSPFSSPQVPTPPTPPTTIGQQ
ncbi:MAG: PspC domain-containing protein [Acidimicrobiia bacterium]|nr:PspC domain-containing protein [Acidimicrobiia bacterium]